MTSNLQPTTCTKKHHATKYFAETVRMPSGDPEMDNGFPPGEDLCVSLFRQQTVYAQVEKSRGLDHTDKSCLVLLYRTAWPRRLPGDSSLLIRSSSSLESFCYCPRTRLTGARLLNTDTLMLSLATLTLIRTTIPVIAKEQFGCWGFHLSRQTSRGA